MTGMYTPIVKTLKKAKATLRTKDSIVLRWEVEVIYAFEGDDVNPAWSTTYSTKEDVEYLGKTQEQFTKSELIAFIPPVHDNHIFHAHYEANNFPPTTEVVSVPISSIPE